MDFLRRNKLFIINVILTFIFLTGVYYFSSVGIRNSTLFLQMRRYIPCAIAVGISISFWQGAGLSIKKLLPHALVAFLWVIVYPFCYWFAFHKSLTFIDNHFDQAFGAYFFAFSVCLRILSLKLNNWKDRVMYKFCFGLLHAMFLLIPVTQLGYFCVYHFPITQAAAVAVLQTNFGEAKEYLLLNLGYSGILMVGVFWIVLFGLLYKMNELSCVALLNNTQLSKVKIAVSLAIVLVTVGYGCKMFKETGVMKAYICAKDYF